eukprot:gene11060-12228_t
MAHTSVNQYLTQIDDAISEKEGTTWAELISYSHPHVANPKLQLQDASGLCQKWFQSPLDEMIASHLRTLPVLYAVAMDLRQFALNADRQLSKSHQGKFGERLEKAAEALMILFRVCVSDTRVALEKSKKWGMLAIVNQLFKIYFKINKLQLCKPLIRAIDSLPIKDQFKMSHLVTYRLILVYLLPVKMQLGRMPSIKLLRKYDLPQFIDIAKAVCVGNLLLLNQALEQHQDFFIRSGIYLILEKLKIITYRNLFKKTCLLMNTHQLPIDAFKIALHYMGATDVDTDEVHCILANLIYLEDVTILNNCLKSICVKRITPYTLMLF